MDYWRCGSAFAILLQTVRQARNSYETHLYCTDHTYAARTYTDVRAPSAGVRHGRARGSLTCLTARPAMAPRHVATVLLLHVASIAVNVPGVLGANNGVARTPPMGELCTAQRRRASALGTALADYM